MKNTVLIAVLTVLLVSPAVAAEIRPDAKASARAEQAALAELLSARIKSALQGEAYTLDKTCDDTTGCTLSIRP